METLDKFRTIFPSNWDLSNYIKILKEEIAGDNLLSMIGYSVLFTVLGTIVNVFFSACAAYCVAKYEFPGKRILYALAIFAMVVPVVGTLPAHSKEFLGTMLKQLKLMAQDTLEFSLKL